MASDERLRELEEKYEGYKVYDNRGDKIGKVDDLFIDESDREEYIGVKMGLFGMKSTLIPMDIVRVNESDRTIEVSESKDRVKDAPNFSDDDDITPEYEDRIRSHFGLESLGGTSSRGSYGGYGSGAASTAGAGAGAAETRDRDTDDRDTEDRGTRDAGDPDGRDHDDDRDRASGASAGVDREYGERSGSSESGYGSASESESGASRNVGSSTSSGGDQRSGGGSSFSEGETREMPTNRTTEETETFREGGRTKVRRRIVREEIIEEDPDQR